MIENFKYVMKKLLKTIFLTFRGDLILMKLNRTPRVIFWHGVDEVKNEYIEAEIFDKSTFVKQIDYLIKHFEIISIEEFYNRFSNNSFSKKEIVLTFDDGYKNNLSQVYHILKEKKLPFTIFVSTEHIEKNKLFPTTIARLIILGSKKDTLYIPSINLNSFDISNDTIKNEVLKIVYNELKSRNLNDVEILVNELKNNISNNDFEKLTSNYQSVKPLNWDEIFFLKSKGVTIGSHCKEHFCCHANQDKIELENQIKDSKNIIEKKLNTTCDFFAYPNGDYTELSNLFVKEAGYKMGFSTKKDKINSNHNFESINRIGVQRNFDTFKIHINLYPIFKF